MEIQQKRKIKYTPQGFSYVDVTLEDCMNWGGLGICAGCGEIHDRLKLIFVLTDTYCENCFNKCLERSKNYSKEDIEYDLKIQNGRDKQWYFYHIGGFEIE